MLQTIVVLVLAITYFGTGTPSLLDDTYDGPWRKTLDGEGACWNQSLDACNRVMVISHGGDWNLEYPYDSFPAFQRAWQNEADTVKGDFRVCKDNIGMIMHSSPIEWYESIPCYGQLVEEMSVSECESCKMAFSNYNFTSSPEVLEWSESNVNFMFCVKEDSDIARAISSLIEYNSTHRAMLEVGLQPLLDTYSNQVPGWDQVYYIVEIPSDSVLQTALTAPAEVRSRIILYEFVDHENWGDLTAVTTGVTAVHSAGGRAMAKSHSNPLTATVQNHLHIYELGFDVTYTYNLSNAIQARVIVNTQRGLSPP